MRASIAVLCWTGIVLGALSPASAEIRYHFLSGVEGQVVGPVQFAEIRPEVGPADFTVRLSGGKVGADPINDLMTPHAYLDKWGVGILNPAVQKDVGVHNQVQIDGNQGGEFLRLEFAAPVRLTFLTFAAVGLIDRIEVLADGNLVDLSACFPGSATIHDISLNQGHWPGTIDFNSLEQPLVLAKQWDVRVLGPYMGDGVQLENVGVVPEPATLLLWLTALAGFAYCYARRR